VGGIVRNNTLTNRNISFENLILAYRNSLKLTLFDVINTALFSLKSINLGWHNSLN